MPRQAALTPAALLLSSLVAWSEVPVGPEFQVNTYTTGAQGFPVNGSASVAADAAGNFVVVWASEGQDGDQAGVFARRYNAAGAPLDAEEFRVNSTTAGQQDYPQVAKAPGAGFVVVWASGEVFNRDVFARLFDAAGNPAGSDFRVNVSTPGGQHMPAVAADAAGNFVVTWQAHTDGDGYAVRGRRYSAAGLAQGDEFQVNTFTTGDQYNPSVAMDAAGRFVVVWHSSAQDGSSFGAFGQRFDAAGTRVGLEFQVNTTTTDLQTYPRVTADADGNFIVVWTSWNQDGSSAGVFGQRYDAGGATVGGEFVVNVETAGMQSGPAVWADAGGNFVVVWQGPTPGSGTLDTFGRWFDAAGAGGAEFRLNSYTTGTQVGPAVAASGAGRFVAVWRSRDQDGSGEGIFGQRFVSDLLFRDGFEPPGCPAPPCGSAIVDSVDYAGIAHGPAKGPARRPKRCPFSAARRVGATAAPTP